MHLPNFTPINQLALWQLHRIDPKMPRGELFYAIRVTRNERLIHYIELSEVSFEEIKAASAVFEFASVLKRYSLTDRRHESVPRHDTASNSFRGSRSAPAVAHTPIRRCGRSRAQGWLGAVLHRCIPGTSNRRHLTQNARASEIVFTYKEQAQHDALARVSAAT